MSAARIEIGISNLISDSFLLFSLADMFVSPKDPDPSLSLRLSVCLSPAGQPGQRTLLHNIAHISRQQEHTEQGRRSAPS